EAVGQDDHRGIGFASYEPACQIEFCLAAGKVDCLKIGHEIGRDVECWPFINGHDERGWNVLSILTATRRHPGQLIVHKITYDHIEGRNHEQGNGRDNSKFLIHLSFSFISPWIGSAASRPRDQIDSNAPRSYRLSFVRHLFPLES